MSLCTYNELVERFLDIGETLPPIPLRKDAVKHVKDLLGKQCGKDLYVYGDISNGKTIHLGCKGCTKFHVHMAKSKCVNYDLMEGFTPRIEGCHLKHANELDANGYETECTTKLHTASKVQYFCIFIYLCI